MRSKQCRCRIKPRSEALTARSAMRRPQGQPWPTLSSSDISSMSPPDPSCRCSKRREKPFVLVFWSRDPDGTQHNQGDSLGQLVPGINGPTSLAGVKNADDNLARIQSALDRYGLAATTNIFVAADHGFSTISKQSDTSIAARGT